MTAQVTAAQHRSACKRVASGENLYKAEIEV